MDHFRPVTTVLSDIGGTLLDTYSLRVNCHRGVCKKYLGIILSDEDISNAPWGMPFKHHLEVFLQKYSPTGDSILLDNMVKNWQDIYNVKYKSEVKPHSGVKEVLEMLASIGYKLGIVTNGSRESLIAAQQMWDFFKLFNVMICRDDVCHLKPHPEPIQKALDMVNALPSESVFVGDTKYDILAGKTAGTITIAALWGAGQRETLSAQNPDYLLKAISELPRLLITIETKVKKY